MLSTLKVDEKWFSSWPCIYKIIKIKAGRDTALNNLKLKLSASLMCMFMYMFNVYVYENCLSGHRIIFLG